MTLRRLPRAAVFVAALSLAGCQSLPDLQTASLPTESEAAAEPAEPPPDSPLLSEFRTLLDHDGWQRDVQWSVLNDLDHVPSRRWAWKFFPPSEAAASATKVAADRWDWVWTGDRERVNEREREAVVEVLQGLSRTTDRIGLHAGILAARLSTRPHFPATWKPEDIVAGATPAVSSRAALAETWCVVLQERPGPAEDALTPAGLVLQQPGLPHPIRQTLWHALAPAVWPDRIPELTAALSSRETAPEIRRSALEACVIAAHRQHRDPAAPVEFTAERWPEGLWSARFAEDPQQRMLFARWVTLARHPDALAVLRSQFRDTEALVREAAVQSLGLSREPAARDELRQWARKETDRTQALAIDGLARWGIEEILPYAAAEASSTRVAVAAQLARFPGQDAAFALREMLGDRSLEVQAVAIQTVADWPADWSQPLLLEAVRTGAIKTRQAATASLRQHLGYEPLLPLDGDFAVRDAAVKDLAQKHRIRLELWSMTPGLNASATDDQPRSTVELQSALKEWLTASPDSRTEDTWDRLQRVTARDVPLIEAALANSSGAAAERVLRDLLPRLHPGYAALVDLSSTEVTRRREAARALQQSSQTQPLSEALVRRVTERIAGDQDQLVWQSVIAAVQAESHPAAGQLALLAVHHVWPDIRRLGVGYFAEHPVPEAGVWLLPILHDSQRTLQLAAIQAVARCGNPLALDGAPAANGQTAVAGLRSLLTSTDPEIRLEAVVAMATLRDQQATEELLRMSFDPQPQVREQVALSMGRTGQSRFVEPLIRWSWTESHDRVRQALLASLDRLVAEADRPSAANGLAPPSSIDDKIRMWATWWTSQQARRAPTESFSTGRKDDRANEQIR